MWDSDAVQTVAGVGTQRTILNALSLFYRDPVCLACGTARQGVRLPVMEVRMSNVYLGLLGMTRQWDTWSPRMTKNGCLCGGASPRGSTCPVREIS